MDNIVRLLPTSPRHYLLALSILGFVILLSYAVVVGWRRYEIICDLKRMHVEYGFDKSMGANLPLDTVIWDMIIDDCLWLLLLACVPMGLLMLWVWMGRRSR